MNHPLPADEPEFDPSSVDPKSVNGGISPDGTDDVVSSQQDFASQPADFPSAPYKRSQIAFLSLVVVGLLATFLGLWPIWELLFPPSVKLPANLVRPAKVMWQPDPRISLRVGLTEGIMCLWFFAFGASMGSFLQVVLHRVPRGQSIVSGGSKCPHCQHAIRPTDNLPIVGWLRLGGACRDCGWPIPFRYPLAELIFGALYLALVLLELHLGGTNLPGYSAWPTRLADNLWPHDPIPVLRLLYHLALAHWMMLNLLFAADGNRMPRGLVWFAMLVGVLAPLLWPRLHPVDWQGNVNLGQGPGALWIAVGTALSGLLIGAVVAWRWLGVKASQASQAIGISLWLVSVYLGWQLGLVVAGIAVAIDGIQMLLADRRSDLALLGLLTISMGVVFAAWRWLLLIPGFPSGPLAITPALLFLISLLPRQRKGPVAPAAEPDLLSPRAPGG